MNYWHMISIVNDNFLSDCAQLPNTSVQKQTQLVYSQLSLIRFTILAICEGVTVSL